MPDNKKTPEAVPAAKQVGKTRPVTHAADPDAKEPADENALESLGRAISAPMIDAAQEEPGKH